MMGWWMKKIKEYYNATKGIGKSSAPKHTNAQIIKVQLE